MKEFSFEIDAIPIAASRPRVTRRNTYYKEPYASYKDFLVQEITKLTSDFEVPLFGQYVPLRADIVFYMPYPESMSKKKRLENYWHVKKPDSDNLVKSIKDGMNNLVYHDDGQVSLVQVSKIYSDNPRTVANLYVMENP